MDELGTIVAAEAARAHRELLSGLAPEGVDRRVRPRLEQGAAMPPATLARLRAERRRLMSAAARGLNGPLIFPTVRIQAPRLAELERDDELFAAANQAVLRSIMLTAFLGMPGIALPTGLDRDRLPASVLLSLPAGAGRPPTWARPGARARSPSAAGGHRSRESCPGDTPIAPRPDRARLAA